MIIKLLLKIWPAITPILIYLFWVLAKNIAARILIKKTNKIIDATYQEVDKDGEVKEEKGQKISDFSLENRNFIITLYLSLFTAIICFLFFAIKVPNIQNGKYIPAHMKDGELVPSRIQKN